MFFFYNITFILFFIFFIKFFFTSKKKFSYIKIFRLYLFFLFLFVIFFIKFDYLTFSHSFNYLCLIMNFLLFLSYILTIGLKFVNSPSYYIIDYLKKNNSAKRKEILDYLKEKKMIEERITILEKEKLIVINNNTLSLTINGKIFCNFFLLIKNFLIINSEG